MTALLKARLSGKKNSQVMILLVFALVVLILFLGLAVDLGFAYLTKANLSKSVDSATLIGALNLGQGTVVATSLATNMFYENYRKSARDFTDPVVNVTFTTDELGNTYINVSATAQINTFFIRILPQWKTLTVGATAQGTRARAIIALVLDKSGSMRPVSAGGITGGAVAMPGAVTNFLSYFDDNRDEVAMVTFATVASVDVQMPTTFPPQPFKIAIRAKVISIFPSGAGGDTFSSDGLTNGLVQIARAPVHAGENVLKAVVFFTDGYANTIQDTLNCPAATSYIFGGNAPSEGAQIDFCDPSGNHCCNVRADYADTAVSPSGCSPPCSATQFFSQTNQTMMSFTRFNIAEDAKWRSRQVANAMRANHIFVYSIGLGSGINQTFLKQIANAPPFPGYVKTDYDGEALFAPDASQMGAVFDAVARKIALRLTK